MIPRLKDLYLKKIRQELMKQHNFKNINQVPVLEKIVINVGVGEAKDNPKLLTAAQGELTTIAGQKAVVTRAKKAISNFKIRKGIAIGTKVTMRGNRMWEFFDRFVNIALPRVRDFRGLNPEAFDEFNNYSLGIKEQIIFPEINYDKVEKIHGMDITFVIKNREKKEAVKNFLTRIGMPFRKIDIQDVSESKSVDASMDADMPKSEDVSKSAGTSKGPDTFKSTETPKIVDSRKSEDASKKQDDSVSPDSQKNIDSLKKINNAVNKGGNNIKEF